MDPGRSRRGGPCRAASPGHGRHRGPWPYRVTFGRPCWRFRLAGSAGDDGQLDRQTPVGPRSAQPQPPHLVARAVVMGNAAPLDRGVFGAAPSGSGRRDGQRRTTGPGRVWRGTEARTGAGRDGQNRLQAGSQRPSDQQATWTHAVRRLRATGRAWGCGLNDAVRPARAGAGSVGSQHNQVGPEQRRAVDRRPVDRHRRRMGLGWRPSADAPWYARGTCIAGRPPTQDFYLPNPRRLDRRIGGPK